MRIKQWSILGLCVLLHLMLAVLWVAVPVARGFGYAFRWTHPIVVSAVQAAAAAALMILCLVGKPCPMRMGWRMLLLLLTPTSLVNALFMINQWDRNPWIILLLLILCTGCCAGCGIRYGRPLKSQLVILIASAVIGMLLAYLWFFASLFGTFGEDTVMQTLSSPEGTYCAKVIDSDQGALGGSTVVTVSEGKRIENVLFRCFRPSRTVYTGRWREYEKMEIHWESEHCLIINDTAYEIP